MGKRKMEIFGRLFTGGQVYFLLNPQPVTKDSCWNQNTYAFFVATPRGESTTVITNSFALEYSATPEDMEVSGVLEPIAESFDDLLSPEPEDEPEWDDEALLGNIEQFLEEEEWIGREDNE